MRYTANATQKTCVVNHVRQPHQLNANRQHMHLVEVKCCEDTRPGQQLEAVQRQHANLCNLINAKAVILHTILLGAGGTCYREHTLNQFEQLGLDLQRAMKLACLPLGVLLRKKTLLTARFWSRVLPVTLQTPINSFVLKLCGGGDSRLIGANVPPFP
eukprot:1149740-Pelagomonas_calceolata.AAC.1